MSNLMRLPPTEGGDIQRPRLFSFVEIARCDLWQSALIRLVAPDQLQADPGILRRIIPKHVNHGIELPLDRSLLG